MMSDHDAALLSNDIASPYYVGLCLSDVVHTKRHGACGDIYLGFRDRATTLHEVSLLTWHVRDLRVTAAYEPPHWSVGWQMMSPEPAHAATSAWAVNRCAIMPVLAHF